QRVGQNARHLRQDVGAGERPDMIDRDMPGIAEGGAARRRLRVEERDAVPLALQRAGTADANDAGANDGDVPGHRHHAPVSELVVASRRRSNPPSPPRPCRLTELSTTKGTKDSKGAGGRAAPEAIGQHSRMLLSPVGHSASRERNLVPLVALVVNNPFYPSHHLKAVTEGVALVDEDRVDAVHARPAGDARPDGGDAAHLRRRLDAALEEAADDAFMDELVAESE